MLCTLLAFSCSLHTHTHTYAYMYVHKQARALSLTEDALPLQFAVVVAVVVVITFLCRVTNWKTFWKILRMGTSENAIYAAERYEEKWREGFTTLEKTCLHDGLPIDMPVRTTKHIRYRYREHMFAVR